MLVEVSKMVPSLIIDLRYKSKNNIAGTELYDEGFTAKLDIEAVQAIKTAESDFNKLGFKLVIWDAYRPEEVQKKLREICNDDRYVAKVSNHTKGLAVDVTLADYENSELVDMGGDHDEFSMETTTDRQANNRNLLSEIMQKNGFNVNEFEWWHFDFGVINES